MSLVQCTFTGMHPTSSASAVIEAAYQNSRNVVVDQKVRLENCTFSNNTLSMLPTLLANNKGSQPPPQASIDAAVFYSDSASPSVCAVYEGDDRSTPLPCVNRSLLPLEEAGDGFLTASSEWFLEVQEVRLCAVL